MYPKKVYEQLASTIQAYQSCIKSGNDFADKHNELLGLLVNTCLPHGSGVDAGVTLDLDKSHGEKIVLDFAFHFMDENGMYDGWQDYTLTVTPSFCGGFSMRITGKNRDDIKDYFYQIFEYSLNQVISLTYENDKYGILLHD